MDIIQFVDKNIAVISTIIATLISSLFTLIIQRNSNKSKLKEMAHQTTLKFKEEEYNEIRKVITKILKFLEVLKQPSNFSIHTTDDTDAVYLLASRELIVRELSTFYVDFSVSMNNQVYTSLNNLSNALSALEESEYDFNCGNVDRSSPTYENDKAKFCRNSASKVLTKIEEFKTTLRNQLAFKL